MVLLLGALCTPAAAYEITLTELSSGSYIWLDTYDWNDGSSQETYATGGASLSVPITLADGSVYTSTRNLTTNVQRTRVGDLVTTVLSINVLGSFTGVSA